MKHLSFKFLILLLLISCSKDNSGSFLISEDAIEITNTKFAHNISLINSGDEPISWKIIYQPDWLKINEVSGSIQGQQIAELTLSSNVFEYHVDNLVIEANSIEYSINVILDRPPPNTFSLLTYNIYVGGGTDSMWYENQFLEPEFQFNRFESIITILKQANSEIIFLQEVTPDWWEDNDEALFKEFGQRLNMDYYSYDPLTWLATFSKHPIISNIFISEFQVSENWHVRSLVSNILLPWNDTLKAINVHFHPTSDQINLEEQGVLLDYLNGVNSDHAVIGGDFNFGKDNIIFLENGWYDPSNDLHADKVIVPNSFKYYKQLDIGSELSEEEFNNLFQLTRMASDHDPILRTVGYE